MDFNSSSITTAITTVIVIALKEVISVMIKAAMDRLKGTLTHILNRHFIMGLIDLAVIIYFIYIAFSFFNNDKPAIKRDLLMLGSCILSIVLFSHSLLDDVSCFFKAYFRSKREVATIKEDT